jgi:hypothetical protein
MDASQPTCFGAPNDVPCERPFTCFSNYHTCVDTLLSLWLAGWAAARSHPYSPHIHPYTNK